MSDQPATNGPSPYSINTQCLSCQDKQQPYGPYLWPPDFPNPRDPYVILVPNAVVPLYESESSRFSDNSNDFSFASIMIRGNTYAKITVERTNMLSDDSAKRALLKQSFASFRQFLESYEQEGYLLPGGAEVIANRVASMLTLRLDEMLYYYYGFDPTNGIELSPGMVLQVEAGAFQYVAPYGSSLPGAVLDAFVSSGQTCYTISRNNLTNTLAFNSYLTSLTPYSITPAGAPAANILDLNAAGMARRHWQLVYPAQFISATSVNIDPQLQYNAALLGADTLADLAQAVEAYRNTGTCASVSSSDLPVQCIYFTGRASVVPLIPIIFQNAPRLVPLGTTFRDLAQSFMVQTSGDLAQFMQGVTFTRYSLPGLGGIPLIGPLQALSLPVRIDTNFLSPVAETGLTVWDLPLVLRDQVSWSW